MSEESLNESMERINESVERIIRTMRNIEIMFGLFTVFIVVICHIIWFIS